MTLKLLEDTAFLNSESLDMSKKRTHENINGVLPAGLVLLTGHAETLATFALDMTIGVSSLCDKEHEFLGQYAFLPVLYWNFRSYEKFVRQCDSRRPRELGALDGFEFMLGHRETGDIDTRLEHTINYIHTWATSRCDSDFGGIVVIDDLEAFAELDDLDEFGHPVANFYCLRRDLTELRREHPTLTILLLLRSKNKIDPSNAFHFLNEHKYLSNLIDSMLLLQRQKRHGDKYNLAVRSNDIEDKDFRLRLNKETRRFEIDNEPDLLPRQLIAYQYILQIQAGTGNGCPLGQIAKFLGVEPNNAYNILNRIREKGWLENKNDGNDFGIWSVPATRINVESLPAALPALTVEPTADAARVTV